MNAKTQATLVLDSADFIKSLFEKRLPSWAVYHDLEHTLKTVETSRAMGEYYNADKDEMEILLLSAWFHDSGYIHGPEEHEEKSVEIFKEFISGYNPNEDIVNLVVSCIHATRLSAKPELLIEQIIRDSDLVSLGSPDFFRTNELLRIETEIREQRSIPEKVWLERTEKFLSAHKYYTEYARLKFDIQLEQNLNELRRRLIT